MTTCRWCGERAKHACACGATLCPRDAHFYVDESNRAIIASARPQCAACAGKRLSRPFTEWQAIEALEW